MQKGRRPHLLCRFGVPPRMKTSSVFRRLASLLAGQFLLAMCICLALSAPFVAAALADDEAATQKASEDAARDQPAADKEQVQKDDADRKDAAKNEKPAGETTDPKKDAPGDDKKGEKKPARNPLTDLIKGK